MQPAPSISRRQATFALTALGLGWLVPSSGSAEEVMSAGANICGEWPCGHWKSHCTGHTGKLRACISRGPCNTYECTFSGTFFKLIPFRYTVTLNVTGTSEGAVHFSASKSIPFFGGSFSCCGTATACSFHATYKSPKDRGVFVLSR